VSSAPTSAESHLSSEVCRRRSDCRLCLGASLEPVLSLAPSPPANAFVTASALDREQPRFPLDVWMCADCAHVQLLDVIDPAVLFRDYVYASGTSRAFIAHFERYASDVIEQFGVSPGDLVVDVGSNDGTLLRFFGDRGLRVVGIDPAEEIARRSNASGIETIPEFLTPALARDVRGRYGPARAVTANNVFAHIDDLSSATEAVRTLLAEDGVFVFEVSYLLDIVQKTLFDTIYHEHLDYHSVQPLVPFFSRHGMEVIDASRVDTHGGSVRVAVQLAEGPRSRSSRLDRLIEDERGHGLDRPETFRAFGDNINVLGQRLVAMLTKLRSEGFRIAGFGAPAKATTLTHHFGIGPDVLDFIVDDSPLKQGLFTPGHHVPVVSSTALYEDRPDYVLVLAWNFAPHITSAHRRYAELGGKFIIPLPHLELI
jgi:SAM-dependent methyltransferase